MQKFIKQIPITNIILAVFIVMLLFVCGVIGYFNDSGRISPFSTETEEPTPTETPAAIDLIYCTSPVSLCIISFGQDNSGNMLIVIKNKISGLTEFYTKLTPIDADASELFPCEKVRFAADVYYCTGKQIPDGTMVTMDVYSKANNLLIASGRIPVSAEATPAPITPEPTDLTPPATAEIPSENPGTPSSATETPPALP